MKPFELVLPEWAIKEFPKELAKYFPDVKIYPTTKAKDELA